MLTWTCRPGHWSAYPTPTGTRALWSCWALCWATGGADTDSRAKLTRGGQKSGNQGCLFVIFSRLKLSITWVDIILLLWVILNSILSLIPIYTCSNHQWFATESHITSKIWQRGVRWGMSGFWQRHWASDRHSEPGDRERAWQIFGSFECVETCFLRQQN